ncbi:MAG: hypothetical protein ACPG7U_03465 [Holosporaceae bacterium]
MVPKGNSGITYVVSARATDPRVQGYDFQRQQQTPFLPSRSLESVVSEGGAQQPLLEGMPERKSDLSRHSSPPLSEAEEGRAGSTGDPMKESDPESQLSKWEKRGLYALLGTGFLAFLAWLASKGNGNVTDVSIAGMPGVEPPIWGPNVPFVPSGDAGPRGNGDGKDPESITEDPTFGGEESSVVPSDDEVESSTKDPTFGISASDEPEWVKNAVTSTEDSGFEEGTVSSSSADDTTGQEAATTSTTTQPTTTTSTTTTTEQPTTTTSTTTTTKKPDTTNVSPVVTEPGANHRPYDEVWVEYCEQNINWQPLQSEITYWGQHHQQQPTAIASETLEACRAEYVGNFFYLYYPDNCVYAYDQVNQRSFFRCPHDLDWVQLSH